MRQRGKNTNMFINLHRRDTLLLGLSYISLAHIPLTLFALTGLLYRASYFPRSQAVSLLAVARYCEHMCWRMYVIDEVDEAIDECMD